MEKSNNEISVTHSITPSVTPELMPSAFPHWRTTRRVSQPKPPLSQQIERYLDLTSKHLFTYKTFTGIVRHFKIVKVEKNESVKWVCVLFNERLEIVYTDDIQFDVENKYMLNVLKMKLFSANRIYSVKGGYKMKVISKFLKEEIDWFVKRDPTFLKNLIAKAKELDLEYHPTFYAKLELNTESPILRTIEDPTDYGPLKHKPSIA